MIGIKRKNSMYYHVRITASLVERNKIELIYNGVITDVREMIRIQIFQEVSLYLK